MTKTVDEKLDLILKELKATTKEVNILKKKLNSHLKDSWEKFDPHYTETYLNWFYKVRYENREVCTGFGYTIQWAYVTEFQIVKMGE